MQNLPGDSSRDKKSSENSKVLVWGYFVWWCFLFGWGFLNVK